MNYKNVSFIGTSHISRQSVDEVRHFIEAHRPDIVAIELDRKRLHVLMHKGPRKISFRAIGKIGLKGFLFSIFGAWAEKKLGDIVGIAPGSEMKTAVKLAIKNSIKIALIDQDIEITLKRLSSELTWKEKMRFVADIIKAPFSREKIEFDLSKVPGKEIIKKLMAKLKSRYPNIYKVQVEERNVAIARNLNHIMEKEKDKKILAIMGAGHVDDVISILKKGDDGISYSYTYRT